MYMTLQALCFVKLMNSSVVNSVRVESSTSIHVLADGESRPGCSLTRVTKWAGFLVWTTTAARSYVSQSLPLIFRDSGRLHALRFPFRKPRSKTGQMGILAIALVRLLPNELLIADFRSLAQLFSSRAFPYILLPA